MAVAFDPRDKHVSNSKKIMIGKETFLTSLSQEEYDHPEMDETLIPDTLPLHIIGGKVTSVQTSPFFLPYAYSRI
jgi:hypothetical protein